MTAAASLREFLGALRARFEERGSTELAGGAASGLQLAEAAARLALARIERPRPAQAAVFGPTQAGKSTVVNLIVGERVAEVSPLAGFTVHAHGFALNAGLDSFAWAEDLFTGHRRAERAKLSRADLNAYTLETVRSTAASAAVVWDTPDFDSLAAHEYQRGVLEIAALADVHVFVLSKEKYSDLSVWRLLELIAPLRRPLVIVLNKLTADAEGPIVDALRGQLRARVEGRGESAIVTLHYVAAAEPAAALAARAGELREVIATNLPAPGGEIAAQQVRGAARVARVHWDAWLTPIRAEHAALAEWDRLVAAALRDALSDYQRDYLDHPQRYDSFTRATLELLQLLEIPHVGSALSRARQVVTWPVRKALAAASSAVRRKSPARSENAEREILTGIVEEIPARLQREAARRTTPGGTAFDVWNEISRALAAQHERLNETLDAAVQEHALQSEREIHTAANELYEELKQHPARLNALRATRLTADLGGLVLAVKSAGLNLHDLVVAPAALAFTTMLTEGALGTYMSAVASSLKARQLESARRAILSGGIAREFAELPRAALAGEISAERIATAEAALRAIEGGGG